MLNFLLNFKISPTPGAYRPPQPLQKRISSGNHSNKRNKVFVYTTPHVSSYPSKNQTPAQHPDNRHLRLQEFFGGTRSIKGGRIKVPPFGGPGAGALADRTREKFSKNYKINEKLTMF